jgi:polyhydroxyalkanoate synthase
MYKYLVDSGFTVFTLSWKNPDPTVLHLEWDDYMEMGPLQGLSLVREITGSDRVNSVGYCLGGIAQQVVLAYIAALDEEAKTAMGLPTGLPTIDSATYFATHQDFTMVGDVDVFLSEPEVRFMEWLMQVSGGYLDGRNMAWTFNMLRSNDLLWHYVVHNYLLGKQPPAFDLLYWNSDGTRVPGKVHSYLLREFFLNNGLKDAGAIKVQGVGIDTRKICVPSYAVVGNSDHIVPWQGAFKIREMQGGPVRFILGESGHIAGIINHPAKNKRAYWTNDSDTIDPQEWLDGATKQPGSWWPDWTAWLAERSGDQVAPPPMGSETHAPLMDAPGTYVLEQ